MPVYSFMAYSNSDLGRAGGSISWGTFTVSGAPATMQVQDDDSVLDDEDGGSGQTVDASQQTLATPFDGSYSAGQVVQSVYRYTVTNNTTGETGNAFLIRIYTGTDPSARGSQDGDYYNSFDIPVSPGDSITLSSGNYIGQVGYSDLVVCFTKGTRILTDKGPRLIEELRVGERIATRDNGYQPLRWIGSKTVEAKGDIAPIEICKGVLGNTADLLVSPNHRMLIEAASADLLFAEHEVLVSAKFLCDAQGIRRKVGGLVTYVHLLFERHEIVFANDAPSESFFPGKHALDALEDEACNEVLALFPELNSGHSQSFQTTARLALRKNEARLLSELIW